MKIPSKYARYARVCNEISQLNLMSGLSISISGRWKEGAGCPLRDGHDGDDDDDDDDDDQ